MEELAVHVQTCPACGGVSSTSGSDHRVVEDDTRRRGSSSVAGFICPGCTVALASMEELETHVQGCAACGSIAHNTAATTNHLVARDTSGSRPVACPSCGRVLPAVSSLETHLPACAASTGYFTNVPTPAASAAAATPLTSGDGDEAINDEWIDVSPDVVPQSLHEGMLAIRERVFIVQQWKIFWAVLHPTDIS